METKIDQSLFLSSNAQTQKANDSKLGKDDFLKLLVAQLKHQNPLEPMKDKAFISQMATFSSLEQMTNMNSKLENFLVASTNNQWIDYTSLVGKQVKWEKVSESENGEMVRQMQEGLVQSVHFKNGNVNLEMEDGAIINQQQVITVGLPSTEG